MSTAPSPAPVNIRPRPVPASPGYLADALLEIMRRKVPIMELQINQDSALSYRSPQGFAFWEEGRPITSDEIIQLMDFAADGKYDATIRLLKEGHYDAVLPVKGEGDGNGFRLRVNFYRESGRLAATVRIQPMSIPEFHTLGVSMHLVKIMDRASSGLIIITGPMGSGKSTTCASIIEHYNRTRSGHILTVEDPIEFVFQSKKSRISQREVPTDVPTFSDALRGAKRQHADLIFVGEMRDAETVKTAFQAAEAGALVICTSHADSAVSTTETLLSYFEGNEERDHARNVLANNFRCIVSQRLVPSKDGNEYLLANEFLPRSPTTVNFIRQNSIPMLRGTVDQPNQDDGTISLNASLASLVDSGKVEADEALRFSNERDKLATLLGIADY